MKRIENWLFYIFLFTIPISIRHIFGFEPFNFVEWTSIYIYATDFILVGLFSLWFINWRTDNLLETGKWELVIKPADWFLIAFVAVAGLSIIDALDVQTALFQWVKLIEGVALYFYIKDYALLRFNLNRGFVALIVGGVFQSIIAIAQFMMQGSLGLKYLGESLLAPALSGIAAFFVDGIKIMRAYGTTPHSNVLALYLFISLFAFYALSGLKIENWKLKIARSEWWWHVFHAVILWAFFLTFSRVVIGLWAVNFVIRSFLIRFHKPFHTEFWQNVEMRHRSLKIFWTTITVAVLFVIAYWPYVVNRSVISSTGEAIQLRVLYNHESLASEHNIFGLGMGNFVPWLMNQNLHLNREVYQPVHNIYLLIYSEIGIIGIALFLLFLSFLIYDFYRRLGFKKLYHFSFGLIIVSVLIFGLFDHYLWTIQSGRLLFWLILGLLAGAD